MEYCENLKESTRQLSFSEKEMLQKAWNRKDSSNLPKALRKIYQQMLEQGEIPSEVIVHNPYVVADRTPFL